jgi:hypothetical protein
MDNAQATSMEDLKAAAALRDAADRAHRVAMVDHLCGEDRSEKLCELRREALAAEALYESTREAYLAERHDHPTR